MKSDFMAAAIAVASGKGPPADEGVTAEAICLRRHMHSACTHVCRGPELRAGPVGSTGGQRRLHVFGKRVSVSNVGTLKLTAVGGERPSEGWLLRYHWISSKPPTACSAGRKRALEFHRVPPYLGSVVRAYVGAGMTSVLARAER